MDTSPGDDGRRTPRRPGGAVDLVDVPASGRTYRGERPVRVGDVDPTGRLRLDALARMVQDVSGDDSADADVPGARLFVVRRTVIEERVPARFRERLSLLTFGSGYGSRWAERRVSITGGWGAQVESVTLWVHVDDEGRPSPLGPGFLEVYGEALRGRQVDGRLRHQPLAAGEPGVQRLPWLVRATDLDVLDHVNNAMAWAVLEHAAALAVEAVDAPSTPAWASAPRRVEVEYRDPIDRRAVVGEPPVVLVRATDEALEVTIRHHDEDGPVHVSAVARPVPT
jgi:acyl-ACP thioesterase